MQRRKFMHQSVLAGAGLFTAASVKANNAGIQSAPEKPFKLNYAFHDGMFRNNAGDNFLDPGRSPRTAPG